jgi:hypothetical protein
MPTGFQQQSQHNSFQIPKSAPAPKHGEKADRSCLKHAEPRSFKPRPGH